MKVLLLAAGRGTRISRYLSGNPKCTVDIGGEKLIRYTVDLFHKKGITDIGIVLGYRAEVIREVLSDKNVRFFYNPFYDVTNSIASAWFAKDFLAAADDTLIMNADVYLEEAMLDKILQTQLSPVMFADGTRKEEADYKFKYTDGILEKYGKDLTGDELKEAISKSIREKQDNLVGNMASQGTTPRQLTDLIGSLSDLTSGSGDKGTPVVLVQGYFDNYTN